MARAVRVATGLGWEPDRFQPVGERFLQQSRTAA